MQTLHVGLCKKCGKAFTNLYKPDSPKAQKYCSRQCACNDRGGPRIFAKICKVCRKTFDTSRQGAQFCSLQCLGKYRKQDKPRHCAYCGNEFYVQPSHSDKYCSRKCYEEERTNRTIKTCKKCGKIFKSYCNKVFCSKRCRDDRILKGKTKVCEHCGKSFYICPSHAKATLFCSRTCRFKHKGPSSIEKQLADELDNRNVKYEIQYKVGRWHIDIALPELAIAIECDGDYWHSLPENIERDKRKNENLKSLGWTVIRFTGKSIIKNPSKCADKIMAYLKQ